MRIAARFVSDVAIERGKTRLIDDPRRAGDFDGVLKLVRERRGPAVSRQPVVDRDAQQPPAACAHDELHRAREPAFAIHAHADDMNQEIRPFKPIDQRTGARRRRVDVVERARQL